VNRIVEETPSEFTYSPAAVDIAVLGLCTAVLAMMWRSRKG
jgi:hypothetical protein